ncbi:MAG: murein biosynthesis integral membrane protein MurJ [Cyanobacteria bacterium SZAS-4]|nr:murein biosynthesis integral membrane protein MurJ [Cyanobacteria bacterium SZAS-4]
MSEFKDKEEQPELVVPSAVNLNAEEEADEQASLVPPESLAKSQPGSEPGAESDPDSKADPVAEVDATSTSNGAAPPPAKSKKASLGKSFSLVAILTVVSKLAGLIRDIVIAGVYGAGVLADAYNYAYLFTGNVLILFGGLGGPFHSATVATLNPRKDDPKSGVFITQVMVATGLVLLILAGIVCIIAPYLVQMLAGDYGSNPQIHALFTEQTIYQIRVMSPLIVIAGLIGVTYGILNVYNKLFWPSLSPSIASLAIIVVLICFPDPNSSVPLAIGTLIGAFGQLFAQLPGMFQCNLRFKFSLKPAEGLREYMSILWPAIIGTSIGQLTVYVDSFFCTKMEPGSWTAISNANRLIQLPLGVLITAMLVPILPRFSDLATADKPEGVKQEFRRALNFLWFLSMPLTMVLLVIPKPLVTALYQRVNWHTRDTDLVVTALVFLAPSIVIYIGRDLITRVFYAYKDSKSPYYVGMAAITLKALLDYYFVMQLHMGVGGISLATTLITVFNFSCLAFLLRRKIGSLGITKLFKPFFIMLIASGLGGICTSYVYEWISPLILVPRSLHLIGLLCTIAITSGLGLLIYGVVCLLFKLEEPYMLLRRVKLLPPKSDKE